ncbi:MAG TPA: hypothetical protein VGZ02_02660 [Candidatus Baltobacteraceae bacterium]|nr:hypothetical protein [Candidatus Baltobacteraceae bacterium]
MPVADSGVMAIQAPSVAESFDASSGPLVYIDDVNGVLWTVNLSTNEMRRIGNQGVMLTDLAFDPKNHHLYGVSFNAFYEVNTTTGNATYIGSLGISDANALVFDANGKGYTEGFQNAMLWAIDNVNTGSVTSIGSTGNWKSGGDLTFYNNALILSGYRGTLQNSTKESIVTLNRNTGAVLSAVATNLTQLFGLVSTSTNHLYGFANTSLYRVVPAASEVSKRTVLIRNFKAAGVGQILGAAFNGNFQT